MLRSPTHSCHNLSSADGSTSTNAAPSWSKRCLQVELDSEDPLTAKSLKIFGNDHCYDHLHHYSVDPVSQPFEMHSGWKVDDHIIKILQKMLPSLSKLQKIE